MGAVLDHASLLLIVPLFIVSWAKLLAPPIITFIKAFLTSDTMVFVVARALQAMVD